MCWYVCGALASKLPLHVRAALSFQLQFARNLLTRNWNRNQFLSEFSNGTANRMHCISRSYTNCAELECAR